MKEQQLLIALMNLSTAFRACEDVFNEMDEKKLNSYIAKDYPFALSFNDLASKVSEWSKQARERIHSRNPAI